LLSSDIGVFLEYIGVLVYYKTAVTGFIKKKVYRISMADPRWGGSGTINSFLGKFGVTGSQAKQYGPWAIGGIVVLIIVIFLFRRYKGKAGKLFSLKSKGGGGGSKWDVDLSSSKTKEKKDGIFSGMFDTEPEKETGGTSPAKTKEEKEDEKKKKSEIIDIIIGYLKDFQKKIESSLRNLGSEDYIDVIESMNEILDTIKNRAMKDLNDNRKTLGRLFAGVIEDFLNNLKSYAETVIQMVRGEYYDQAKAYLERMEDDVIVGIREVGKQKPSGLKSLVKKQRDFRGK